MTETTWTSDPPATPEQLRGQQRRIDRDARDAVERGFADGLLVDYSLATEGPDNRDIVIKMVFRHREYLTEEGKVQFDTMRAMTAPDAPPG